MLVLFLYLYHLCIGIDGCNGKDGSSQWCCLINRGDVGVIDEPGIVLVPDDVDRHLCVDVGVQVRNSIVGSLDSHLDAACADGDKRLTNCEQTGVGIQVEVVRQVRGLWEHIGSRNTHNVTHNKILKYSPIILLKQYIKKVHLPSHNIRFVKNI